MNKLANAIYLLRLEKGVSQKELAIKSGIAQANISNIEKGRDFRISTLYRIATALDVTPVDLISGIKPIPINKRRLFERDNIERLASNFSSNQKNDAFKQVADSLKTTLSSNSGRKDLHLAWIKLKRTFEKDELNSIFSRINKAKKRKDSYVNA